LKEGENEVSLPFTSTIPAACYAFVCFMSNEYVSIQTSQMLVTGLVSVFNKILPAVSNWGKQDPPGDIGVEAFEFWCPERRPQGQNIAMTIHPALDCFSKENLRKSPYRPVDKPNAWVAGPGDGNPIITLTWKEPKEIKGITLFTDTDYDHPMESVQWGHHDSSMPFCVRTYTIKNGDNVIYMKQDNYQTSNRIVFDEPFYTGTLKIEFESHSSSTLISLFGICID